MKEFYFVIPMDQTISSILNGHWNKDTLLISASNFYKNNNNDNPKLSFQNHIFNPNKHQGKLIIDSGVFDFVRKKGIFPYTVEEYTNFLNSNLAKSKKRKEKTFGVCMDFICTDPKEKSILPLEIASNKKRIEFTVKNSVYNIENAENYTPMNVIQGYNIREYLYCLKLLEEKNAITDTIGIGSIAIGRSTHDVILIIKTIKQKLIEMGYENIKLHGFGLSFHKLRNKEINQILSSSDSLAWIFALRNFNRVVSFDPLHKKLVEIDIKPKVTRNNSFYNISKDKFIDSFTDENSLWKDVTHITYDSYCQYVQEIIITNGSINQKITKSFQNFRETLILDNEMIKLFSYRKTPLQTTLENNKLSNEDFQYLKTILSKKDQICLYHSKRHKLLSLHPIRNKKEINLNIVKSVNLKNIAELIFNEIY